MQPSTIIEIRKQLESLKQFQEKNAPNRLAYGGYVSEFTAGMFSLALTAFVYADITFLVRLALFAGGLFLFSHAIFLMTRYHYDRRMTTMLEMLLSGSKPSNEP